jgi:hypothetical protein
MSEPRGVPRLDAELASVVMQEDLPPTATKASLSRVIAWIVDKIIEIAAHRRYGTLVMKFSAGKAVQVSFEGEPPGRSPTGSKRPRAFHLGRAAFRSARSSSPPRARRLADLRG